VITIFVAATLAHTPAHAGDVVSLNLCTDEYLVLLAPERVAALTVLARDPTLSVVSEQARRLPAVRPSAEAVLALHPALVLAGPFGAQTTLMALETGGVKIVRTTLPADFAAIRAETRRLAALLDVPARGEAIIADMDARLAALPTRPRETALMLEARGWTAGPGSLGDAVLSAAGLGNAGTGGRMSLEGLAAHPPGLLAVPTRPATPSLATDFLTHPVLRAVKRREIPPALLACGGPWSVGAVEILAR
jgi:iron complex transport system substrate-binding protein